MWDDVDFRRKVVHVRQRANLWCEIGAPKSAAGDREIPMAPMVVDALRERLQALLGHSSIQMTFDRYGHLFPSLEDDHAKLAAGELSLVAEAGR
jgi:integrase